MKRIIALAGVLLVVAAGGGYFAYGKYTDNKLIDAQVPAVKNASLRLTNALKLTSSNITYREVFEHLDKDVTDLDQKLLDVQTVTTPSTAKWLKAIGAYYMVAQTTLRAESASVRKQMFVSTAMDLATSANERYAHADNEYAVKAYRESRDDALRDMRAKIADAHNAATEYDTALTSLAQARESLTSFIPPEALIDPVTIDTAHKGVAKLLQQLN